MKMLRLIKTALSRDILRRILLSAELIIGLVFFFLSISLLMTNREIDRYTEMYGDMAAIDPNNKEQEAYAEAHGTLFAPTVQLEPEERSGKAWHAEINSLDFYQAVPLSLSAGEWFPDENFGSTYNAVIPHSLRNRFSLGRSYEVDFRLYGKISFYVCGVLDSDVTFGNGYNAAFSDMNCIMQFCLAKGAQAPDFNFFTRRYVRLNEPQPEALRALNIYAVCLVKDSFHQGNHRTMATPLFLTMILLVLFGTALIGDHFLSAKENEKMFAVYFLCGAGTHKAVLLQSMVNLAEILIPYLLSLAAAWIIRIRLYPFSVIGILLVLIFGSALLSFIQMLSLSRKSPSQIIARRLRG